jgi:hypothetical protein
MPEASGLPSSSRALVLVDPVGNGSHACRPARNAATFVTHLIATARGLPQAREHRRADPQEVIAAYRATIARIRALNNQ